MLETIQPYFGEAFTALVVGLPTWFIARRKNNADATTTEIDNGSKVVDLYKDALNDLPARYEEKFQHVQDMAHNVEKLFEKKEALLLQEIEYHKKQAALYKKMYDDKVREFIKYKKEHP
jgi:hypothetical protein